MFTQYSYNLLEKKVKKNSSDLWLYKGYLSHVAANFFLHYLKTH